MRLERHPAGPILRPDPTHDWEAGSVLNGTVIRSPDGLVHMLYRATNGTAIGTSGAYVSSIGHAVSRDGVAFERRPEPLIRPDQPYEHGLGCEDPRVVRIGDEYYIHYTAVEGEWGPGVKVRIALATTKDFESVTKHGVVGPIGAPSKAAALLPEPVGGQYVWYFTWCSDTPGAAVLHARFDDLDQVRNPPPGFIAGVVENYDTSAVLISGDRTTLKKSAVRRGPELGAPPLKTDRGWLLFYCPSDHEPGEPEWQIAAALLDLDEPWRVIARTTEPLLRPETPEELHGVVARVTFPSGALVVGERVHVYYGTGDQGIALATCDLTALLDHLELKENRVFDTGPCVG
jgi:beta-1,2-mannobiose phosphorylase / 1,2-beta-oligomannan phosphorylase